MIVLSLLLSAHASCTLGEPLPVATVGKDAHAVVLAEAGSAAAVGWIDDAGAHLAIVGGGSPKDLGAAVDLLVLGDGTTWVAVTRASQWADHGACEVVANRMRANGHRAERRVLLTEACTFESPALAATLRDGTLFVAATTTGQPGGPSRDLRIARWAKAPALPESLDAVFSEQGIAIDGLAPTADGLELYWSNGGDHRKSILDAQGIPRGPAQHSAAPFAFAPVVAPGATASIEGTAVQVRRCAVDEGP